MPEFTTDWFEQNARATWTEMFDKHGNPERVLEVGSYEGAATCWLLSRGVRHITCVDTWLGGVEHTEDFGPVYERFRANIAEARSGPQQVIVKQGRSDMILPRLISGKAEPFDFIYIDGSHLAPDVLADAVLAWRLLRSAGLMCFDDHVWDVGVHTLPYRSPRIAIEAFIQCYWPWISIHQTGQQLWVKKHLA